jgi:hypothetical protein
VSVAFEVHAEGVDVEAVMKRIRERIAEKKRLGLLTDAEVREVADHPLHPVLDAHDLQSGLLGELLGQPDRWNYRFDPESIYRSSREGGEWLERVRRWLRPVQKLFWNPTPMISAVSRQSDLNLTYVHLLHNLVLESTRLNLQVQDLQNRVRHLQGRLDFHARREKVLEQMLAERAPGEKPDR